MRNSSNQKHARHLRFKAVLALFFLPETLQGQTLTTRAVRGGVVASGNNVNASNIVNQESNKESYESQQQQHQHTSLSDPKCFASTEELRHAVDQYQGEDHYDHSLAAVYGWPISAWCVSNIQDFSNLFQSHRWFDESLADWDVSHATDLSGMFQNCHWLQNQDFSQWDTSNVRTMARMFAAARSFNNPSLQDWNTERVTDMSYMFLHAFSFSQTQALQDWNIGRVQTMEGMFRDARSLDATELHWDVSHVRNTKSMVSSIPGVSLNLLRGGPVVLSASNAIPVSSMSGKYSDEI